MKFIRKKKHIVGIFALLAFISIGSIGFSSWILSIEQKEELFSANINIATSWNATAILNVTSTTNSISSDTTNSNVANYKVPLEGDVIFANDIEEEVKKGKLVFSLDAINKSSKEVDGDKNKMEATNNLFGRTNGYIYSYFKTSLKEFNVSNLVNDPNYELSGYSKLNLSLEDFSIEYGDYFNNENPQEFYDGYITTYKNNYLENRDNEEALNTYLEAINQAKNELREFFNSLNNVTLNINVELVFDDKSTN